MKGESAHPVAGPCPHSASDIESTNKGVKLDAAGLIGAQDRGFISQLVEAVPCLQLAFVPDKRVIDLVLGSPVSKARPLVLLKHWPGNGDSREGTSITSAAMPQSGRQSLPGTRHFFPGTSVLSKVS